MRNSKRILWVDHTRFDLKPNKSPLLEISQGLTQLGFEVLVLTGYVQKSYQAAKSSVIMKSFASINVPGLYRLALLIRQALWLLFNAKHDDVIVLSPDGLFLAPLLVLRGKRNIHLDVRTVPVEINSLRKRLARLMYWKFPMLFLRQFIKSYSFITDRLKASIEKEFHFTVYDSVQWHSGVNTDKFSPTPTSRGARSSDRFVLLYHGTISRNRGLDRVVKALANLSPFYRARILFVVVGSGPYLSQLIKLVGQHDLADRVLCKGLIPYDDMPTEITKADCGICPLTDRPEWIVSSPIKVFEYMASGLPMILTPIAAHIDVATGHDFVVWTDGYEISDFCRAIEYAFDNRETLSAAAAKAVQIARDKYDWSKQARKFGIYLGNKFHFSA